MAKKRSTPAPDPLRGSVASSLRGSASTITVCVRDDQTGHAHYFRVSAQKAAVPSFARGLHGLVRDLYRDAILDVEPMPCAFSYPIPLKFEEPPRRRPPRLPLASCLLPRTGKGVPA